MAPWPDSTAGLELVFRVYRLTDDDVGLCCPGPFAFPRKECSSLATVKTPSGFSELLVGIILHFAADESCTDPTFIKFST